MTSGLASRRGLLGAAAGLALPGIAAAQRGPAAPPVLWLPAFDPPRLALLRAMFATAAFQSSLARGVEPAPRNDGTMRYGADMAHAGRVLRDWLGMAAPHWTEAQRRAAEAAHSWDGFFDPTDNPAYRPNLYRGDVADQIALWLVQTVMMERARTDDLTLPSGQAFSDQLWLTRGQVIAGLAETGAVAAMDEAGRRECGLWMRLNYVAMNRLLEGTAVRHDPVARVQAAARRLPQQGVEIAPFLRQVGLNAETLRLTPQGVRDTALMAAAR